MQPSKLLGRSPILRFESSRYAKDRSLLCDTAHGAAFLALWTVRVTVQEHHLTQLLPQSPLICPHCKRLHSHSSSEPLLGLVMPQHINVMSKQLGSLQEEINAICVRPTWASLHALSGNDRASI